MADQKLTDLDVLTDPATDDLTYVVDISAGLSGSKQLTLGEIGGVNAVPLAIADSSDVAAANGTLFNGTDHGFLAYKDSTGTVSELAQYYAGPVFIADSSDALAPTASMYNSTDQNTLTYKDADGNISPLVSVQPSGDPATDTASIQAALDQAGVVRVGHGNYTVEPLSIPANTELILEPGCVLTSTATYGTNDCILNVSGDDVTITGYGATITMAGQYTAGEQRHGIRISSSKRTTVAGVKVEECGGDGVYLLLGGEDTSVVDVWCHRNRRQGCSITGGIRASFTRCRFTETGRGLSGGTAPQAGLDIEPNAGYHVKDLTFTDCSFDSNASSGVTVNCNALSSDKEFSAKFSNCVVRYNMGTGVQLSFFNSSNTTASMGVVIDGCSILDNNVGGLGVQDWWVGGPKIMVTDCVFRNGNYSRNTSELYKCFISVYRNLNSVKTYEMGNVSITNPNFVQTVSTATTTYFNYTSGNGTQPELNELVTDNVTGAYGYVLDITVNSGTWAGGDAAGIIRMYMPTDAFGVGNGVTCGEGGTCTVSSVALCLTHTACLFSSNYDEDAPISSLFLRGSRMDLVAQPGTERYRLAKGERGALIVLDHVSDESPVGQTRTAEGSIWTRSDGSGEVYSKTAGEGNVGWHLASTPVETASDADTLNGSIYYSTDQGSLVYKAADGTIYPLLTDTPVPPV